MGTIDTIRDELGSYLLARGARRDYVRKLVARVGAAVIWFEQRLEKRRTRMSLLELTDEQLKDIGISRAQAQGEAWRRFWD
jgi:uncharacterized protein YjiS (DUF1127 family)